MSGVGYREPKSFSRKRAGRFERKRFSRTADSSRAENFSLNPMRGGFRL